MKLSTNRLMPALLLSLSAAAAQAGDAPVVSDAWARATAPGVEVGAAYMVIEGGGRADRLVGASSGRAAMVELHDVTEVDGVARMRGIEALEIPARGRVELAPKGRHLMLMGLSAPLVAGQQFQITLRFAESGPQAVTVTVRPATAGD
jgi:copper(I)-binding protein